VRSIPLLPQLQQLPVDLLGLLTPATVKVGVQAAKLVELRGHRRRDGVRLTGGGTGGGRFIRRRGAGRGRRDAQQVERGGTVGPGTEGDAPAFAGCFRHGTAPG
jgi:hypothetical protein